MEIGVVEEELSANNRRANTGFVPGVINHILDVYIGLAVMYTFIVFQTQFDRKR